MADPLYDILNSVAANPQTATPPPVQPDAVPSWIVKLNNAIGGVMDVFNPLDRMTMKNIVSGEAENTSRKTMGQLARVPTDVAGGVVSLPNLPDTLSQALGGPELPHVDALNTAAEAIHQKGQDIGEAVAGQPLNDSLLTGSRGDLSSSWARLFAGAAIPLPGSWQAKISSGLQKVKAGSDIADKIAAGAVQTMEVLTPLTLNPKAAMANVAVASTLAPTLEMAVANHDQAQSSIKAGSDQTTGAVDVAAQGAQEVRDVHTVKASLLPSITGDDTTDAIIGASLLGAATLAQAKFNIAGRVLSGTKKALTSYDPNNPLDRTNMSTWDLIQQQTQNRNTTPETAFRKVLESQGAPNIDARMTAVKESNAMRTGASVDTRMKSLITDGQIPDSAVKVAPINDHYVAVSQLAPDEAQLLDRALLSQQEKDVRSIYGIKHNLYNTDIRDLEAYITQARANPRVSYLMDNYFKTNRLFTDYLEEQNAFSRGELNNFRKNNPNYVASELTGGDTRWLSPQRIDKNRSNTGLETFEQLGSPTKLWPQYIDEVVRSTEGKKIKRDFFNEFTRAANAGDAYATSMIGRTMTKAPPPNSAGRFVHWRDARGESRWTEVTDAAVRNSLQDATNPSALQLNKGFADATRWYEQGAVGTGAAVTGSVFAPKSYLYNRTFGSAFRPAGIAVSPLDKLVQAASGGKFGFPEPFTALPQDLWNMVNGASAVLWQRGAMALRNSTLRDGPLAKSLDAILPKIPIGPNTARAAADGMATIYKKHGAYELQQRGLLGPSTFASVDPALSYRAAESVLRSHGLLGQTKEAVTFVSDILHAISSAPGTTTLQLNRGVDKAAVSQAIRNMSGDPGASGAFRNAGGFAKVVNTIPWGNIFLQSGFRMIKGFKENPHGAVAGITTAAVAPEILTGMWNASAGPEYLDYQYNQRSPDQQASSVYIAVPGRLPSEGVEIPIDPWLRPFKQIGSLLAGSYLGLLDGRIYHPDNATQLQAIKDAVQHRQMGSPFQSGTVPNSIMNQVFMPPVPGPIAAGAAAFGGVQLRNWNDVRAISDKHNAGFTEGTGPKGSMFLDKFGPSHLEDIVRGIAAQAGANIYTMLNETLTRRFSQELGRNETDQSWKESAKQGVTANLEQKLKDSGRMFGTGSLFDSALAISPGTEAAGVLVKDKLDGLRKISEAFANSTLTGGTPQTVVGDKKRGFQDYMGVAPVGAADQTMDIVGREATRIYRELSSSYGGARKDLFDQRQSIANSSRYSPQMKRYMMNEVSDQIVQMDRRMLVDMERHEAVISQQLGVNVKFDKLNLNQGKGQFK